MQHGFTYQGVDVSEHAVARARKRGLNARRISDAAQLPMPDDSFDAVVCIEVLEHLFSPMETMLEIKRVLRPGGVLIATVPNVAYWRRRLDLALLGRWNPIGDVRSVAEPWRDPHIRFFNPGALRRLVASAGMNIVASGGHAGGLLRDLPWLGVHFEHDGDASLMYRWLERAMPSLFGAHIHAIARKGEMDLPSTGGPMPHVRGGSPSR